MTRRLSGWLLLVLLAVPLVWLLLERAPVGSGRDAQQLVVEDSAGVPSVRPSTDVAPTAAAITAAHDATATPVTSEMADDIARVRAALGPVVPGELPQLSQVVGASAATPTNATARGRELVVPASDPARGRELVVPASDPARGHEVMRADWVVSEGDERVTERSLRAAAQSLERVAAELEEQHRYAEADRLWAASRGLRHAARNNWEKPSDSVENEQSPE